MKKIILFAGVMAVAFVSCKKSSNDDSGDSTVIPCDNVAAFTAVVDTNGATVFTDASTGHVTARVWDFGDNSPISMEKNPTHNYTAPGIFTVTLTVNNANGDCENITTVNVTVPISNSFPVPTTFTKKVLIEEFTGVWCGWCPDGAYKMDLIIDANPDRAYGASVHQGDPMELSLYNSLNATFNVSGFPTGMVGRIPQGGVVPVSRSLWSGMATNQLSQAANCGLAIDSRITGTDMTIEVHSSFKTTVAGNHNITVYLTEDGINKGSAYDQHNYLNTDANSVFYQLGDPMVGYKHNNVIVKVVTASNMGDAIPASYLTAGTHYKKTYTVSIANYNKAKLHVIAFVNKVGTTPITHEIINVQKVNAGELKAWD